MTAVQPAYVCDEAEARDLTDQIKSSHEKTWRLILRAHEWKAWAALGHNSWRDYVVAEFGLSQSAAYRMLDTGRVIEAIEQASGVSQGWEISDAAAGDLKPHLDKVTEAVAAAVADIPEDQRPAAAAAAIKVAREQYRPQSSPPPAPEGATGQPTGTAPHTGGGEPHVPDLTGINLTAEQYQAKVTALGETVPVEQRPSDVDLDRQLGEHLDENPASKDDRYRLNLARAIVGCQSLLDLAPTRAVQTYEHDSDEAMVLGAFLDRMDAWTRSVRAGLRLRPTILRSVR